MTNIHTLIAEEIEKFRKEMLNPDKLSSQHQFRPELSGKLPEAFESFLAESLLSISKKTAEEWDERLAPKVSMITGYQFGSGVAETVQEFLDQYYEQLKPSIRQLLTAERKRISDGVQALESSGETSDTVWRHDVLALLTPPTV